MREMNSRIFSRILIRVQRVLVSSEHLLVLFFPTREQSYPKSLLNRFRPSVQGQTAVTFGLHRGASSHRDQPDPFRIPFIDGLQANADPHLRINNCPD